LKATKLFEDGQNNGFAKPSYSQAKEIVGIQKDLIQIYWTNIMYPYSDMIMKS